MRVVTGVRLLEGFGEAGRKTRLQLLGEHESHYAKEGMLFSYWPAKELPKSEWPKFNISRGPCGELAHVRSMLVNPPDPRLIPYRAVEVDSSGTAGNIIDVFIGRGFGHNFNPDRPWDTAFVDRVHAVDTGHLERGTISPTHMIAQ